jgi:hypothetical protein
MAGKQCNGVKDFNNSRIVNSRAYCEGVQARIVANDAGAASPHETDSEADQCYIAGVAVAAAAAGSTVDPADAPCCAVSQATVAV